jgi:hypothetical protein
MSERLFAVVIGDGFARWSDGGVIVTDKERSATDTAEECCGVVVSFVPEADLEAAHKENKRLVQQVNTLAGMLGLERWVPVNEEVRR